MQPVGSAAPASIKPVQGEQSPSDQLDRFADPTRCPDPACNAPVPELYKQQSSYVCRACGCWRLHTGIITMPVAGPPGTRPEYIRASAPFWQTTNAQPAATPTANAPGGDDRPEVKAPPPADGRPLPPARHSKDFRSVHWYGDGYSFTPTQAHCIKVLWEAWENGTPDVGQETILEHPEVEAESRRLADVFKGHPAWGKMIVKGGTAGAYRLANPPLDN